jgi:cytidylate kinase
MAIITISRGSYSRGRDVAERLAGKLGYECISREILLEASKQFDIPQITLLRAVRNAPSILDRYRFGKERYVAYVRAALLKHVQRDDVVYHGFAGHFFLQAIPFALNVQVLADTEDRVREVMKREKLPEEEARRALQRIDEERSKWSQHLYGIDTRDASLYDMVLNLRSLSVDDAVALIGRNIELPAFQSTSETKKILDNFVLAAQVEAALIAEFPQAKVSARDGDVFVAVHGSMSQQRSLTDKARDLASFVDGVKQVDVHFVPLMTAD